MAIVEFAAHVAYLHPATGTGYVVVPRPELDMVALDEYGRSESAGRTAAGMEVLCLYGPPPAEDPTLKAIRCAVIALDMAADIQIRS